MVPFDPSRQQQQRFTRRRFMQTLAVAGLASAIPWITACGAGAQQEATASVIEMTDQSNDDASRSVGAEGRSSVADRLD